MAWFQKVKKPLMRVRATQRTIPEGVWVKCVQCKEMIYKRELERNEKVCPKCQHHYRLGARERIALMLDIGSFVEDYDSIRSTDPLRFRDATRYPDRLKAAMKEASTTEAVICGRGTIEGFPACFVAFEFAFMGGSMGSVVGERITRSVEKAIEESLPLIMVTASGGARMQEGVLSLMQLAKTTSALAKMSRERLPYISILTDPTTGGVTASVAMLGDVIVAEPGALIGFAGPRVIEQTIQRKLPEGFQRAEFLLEHGMVDMVVHRKKLKSTVAVLLALLHEN